MQCFTSCNRCQTSQTNQTLSHANKKRPRVYTDVKKDIHNARACSLQPGESQKRSCTSHYCRHSHIVRPCISAFTSPAAFWQVCDDHPRCSTELCSRSLLKSLTNPSTGNYEEVMKSSKEKYQLSKEPTPLEKL